MVENDALESELCPLRAEANTVQRREEGFQAGSLAEIFEDSSLVRTRFSDRVVAITHRSTCTDVS